jgi:hypothetical protein
MPVIWAARRVPRSLVRMSSKAGSCLCAYQGGLRGGPGRYQHEQKSSTGVTTSTTTPAGIAKAGMRSPVDYETATGQSPAAV